MKVTVLAPGTRQVQCIELAAHGNTRLKCSLYHLGHELQVWFMTLFPTETTQSVVKLLVVYLNLGKAVPGSLCWFGQSCTFSMRYLVTWDPAWTNQILRIITSLVDRPWKLGLNMSPFSTMQLTCQPPRRWRSYWTISSHYVSPSHSRNLTSIQPKKRCVSMCDHFVEHSSWPPAMKIHGMTLRNHWIFFSIKMVVVFFTAM